jgi:hypothetical protein
MLFHATLCSGIFQNRQDPAVSKYQILKPAHGFEKPFSWRLFQNFSFGKATLKIAVLQG